jgi:hypothetical protein
MKTIKKDSADELVIEISSRLALCVGIGSLVLLCLLLFELSEPNALKKDRWIGLAGASATCALFFLFGYETGAFRFDSRTRSLTWSKRHGPFKKSGSLPFDSIEDVVLQPGPRRHGVYRNHRVVLITRDGDLPLMTAYEYDKMNRVIVEKIRTLLGMPSEDFDAGVRLLVERSEEIAAIDLVREKRGLSLAEARDQVEKLKQEKRRKNPSRRS